MSSDQTWSSSTAGIHQCSDIIDRCFNQKQIFSQATNFLEFDKTDQWWNKISQMTIK